MSATVELNEHTLTEAVDFEDPNRTEFVTIPSIVTNPPKLLPVVGGVIVKVRSELG